MKILADSSILPKAANAFIKEFPNATSGHMNQFSKASEPYTTFVDF
jgi:hypothetical protein